MFHSSRSAFLQLPSIPYGISNLEYQSFLDFLMDERQAYKKIPDDRFSIDACVCTVLPVNC
ncbi:uncharacterized protein HD556DRAFT_1240043 [Suillus plorans]|uniref:Uncharacterized protein n=1 Tax=Suillus plorans TaxID=116603 RepID=A0A9P7AMS4_9AGAM|nr:uncharacterized protein HD556DRAFT_1240043 [Suillus plorans]KAG1791916.1 hypothetical protein HD556DRAFT_1240043 [Suillus plorans]